MLTINTTAQRKLNRTTGRRTLTRRPSDLAGDPFKWPTLEEWQEKWDLAEKGARKAAEFDALVQARDLEVRKMLDLKEITGAETTRYVQEVNRINTEIQRTYTDLMKNYTPPDEMVPRVNTMKKHWDKLYAYVMGALGVKVKIRQGKNPFMLVALLLGAVVALQAKPKG